jgi:hypothetical protein
LVVSARSAVVFALRVSPVFGCLLVCGLVFARPAFLRVAALGGLRVLVPRCCFPCGGGGLGARGLTWLEAELSSALIHMLH